MIIGILFGAVLISFGDMFPRMLDRYKEIITNDMISSYQYILYDYEEADEVTDIRAEKFAMSSYDYSKEGFLTDSISVYGIYPFGYSRGQGAYFYRYKREVWHQDRRQH